MPNKPLADWQKVVIMSTSPFFGNRTVAKKAECSVYSVRKYRERMKERNGSLDVDVESEPYEDTPYISEDGMDILDEIVEDALEQGRGRL